MDLYSCQSDPQQDQNIRHRSNSLVANTPCGNSLLDFSNSTGNDNNALITQRLSVTGCIVDPPLNDHVSSWADRSQATVVYDPLNDHVSSWADRSQATVVYDPLNDHVSSWADRSQATVVYDPFNMALFKNEFGIYDHSMGMVNDLNYLYATTGIGHISMQHINPGSAHLNGAFDIPDFGSNFVCSNHDQLTNASIPTALMPVPTRAPATTPTRPMHLHRCNFPTCTRRFKRPADLARHQYTVHFNIQGHLCPIVDCPKARGKGYSRADKVTEHLWRKHGDLGYIKAQG